MKIPTFGMGRSIQVLSEYKSPDIDYMPRQEAKVKSIMKMQEQVVALENHPTFIKQTQEYKSPDIDYMPRQEAKVKSIMKMQEQVVAMENHPTFIKQTIDDSDIWKYKLSSRLNII